MADCSNHKNPLIRSGTNQAGRFLPALDPAFVVPDENRVAHWLVYARQLSAHLKYYTSDNTYNSSWQPFFDSDVAAQLALIAVQDVDEYKDQIRALLNGLLSKEAKDDAPGLRRQFGLLFSAVFTLAYRIDYFARTLPETASLKLTLINLIQARLAPALKRLLGYYKAATTYYTPPLIEGATIPGWEILAFQLPAVQEVFDLLIKQASNKWIYKAESATSVEEYYTNHLNADKTIYNHTPAVVADTEVWQVLNHAANHNMFTSVFAEFMAVYARMVKEAQGQLIQTVTSQNTHEPHYALYLTFLQLFTHAQGELNRYTQRHLDFYYKDVLRLLPRKSQPNQVHLLIELAANTREYLIKKGTAFKAGKDSQGKEALYTSDRDVVINRASVASMRTFYRATAQDKVGPTLLKGMLYASPEAASADGAGAKLTTFTKDWHPFANKQFRDGKLSAIAMPEARIGFAISSHYLFLKEGKRRVTITLQGNLLSRLSGKEFTCYLSTEKNWLEKPIRISSTGTVITLDIDPADPPITAFVQKVHLDNFRHTDTPVIKFVLKNIPGKDQYDELKDVTLTSVDIRVQVGELNTYHTGGIKELLVSSDVGSVDPSKPFQPFGQNPKSGAGIIIGNKEIFSKQGAKLTVSVAWAELDLSIQDMDLNLTDLFFPTAQMKFLENGVWKDAAFTSVLNAEHTATPKSGELELFWGKDSVMIPEVYLPSTQVSIPDASAVAYSQEYLPYGISSKAGFFKLQLNNSFGLDEYFTALQLYLIGVANKTKDPDKEPPPVQPYIPKIESIQVSYEASTSISFSASYTGKAGFIHLYPFGVADINSSHAVSNAVPLLPQFVYKEGTEKVPAMAEFYIGLKDLVPAQRIDLLLQVLEGSTHPLQSKPEQHVYWSYLANNGWVDFDKQAINDGTRQLIMSGIISFPVPEKASKDNTVLPSGLHWVKASIRQLPEQVCRLIDVKAQAIGATYVPRNNAEDFLKQTLAAGSISKLHIPDAAVKKVEQPYTSFGGRFTEDTGSFYTRVSERLRHKNRAITIRDIEQLVLEAFPDIHKVKCLNHTRLDLNEAIYNEQAAGHVTVITIPGLHQKNAIDPLRPYTSRSRLEKIREFLQQRSNCHMQWHVENPVFEEVRISTSVVLRGEAAGNNAFYREQLQQELVQFLTPWAYNAHTDIAFGGKITKSELINFIEERSYVEVILNLRIFHNRMDGKPEKEAPDEILASTARSILVSAPASGHAVEIIDKPQKPQDDDCQ